MFFIFGIVNAYAQKELTADKMQLQKNISDKLPLFPEAKYGIAFHNLATGEQFFMNAEDSFHAASTMKTPLMIELFRLSAIGKLSMDQMIPVKNEFASIVDGSKYSLDSTNDSEHDLYTRIGQQLPLKNLIFRMITMSSNLATNILIELAGAKNVIATMRKLGAAQIQVRRGVEDSKAFEAGLNNRTNAIDLMKIFTEIAKGTAVDKAACDSMIGILMHQHFTERIPARLPPGVKTATKSGSITKVCHDSGIVFLPDGRKYVIVILTSGIESEDAASNLIADISKMFYDYVEGSRSR